MITPMDVLSDAVKIGLGALITGLAAYWLAKDNHERMIELAKANHDKTLEKERAQRKRELLEGVAQRVARVNKEDLEYFETLKGWLESTPALQPISEYWLARLGEISDTTEEFTSVQATLLLLGEVKCSELFNQYVDTMPVYSNADLSARTLTVERLEADRAKLRIERKAFNDELSNVYRKL